MYRTALMQVAAVSKSTCETTLYVNIIAKVMKLARKREKSMHLITGVYGIS